MIEELRKSVLRGKERYQQLSGEKIAPDLWQRQEVYAAPDIASVPDAYNCFFAGDNRDALRCLVQGNETCGIASMAGKINLIYIDPPFDSQKLYHYQVNLGETMLHQPAYSDRWQHATFDYLEMLTERLYFMYDLLAEDGSILLHIDYHISHYVKIVMDEIFGRNRFINEIVWCYGGGGAPKKHYTRKHDVILWYAKGKDWFFQPQYRPYRPGTLERGLTAVKGNRYELHREGATLDDWWAEPEVQKILSPTARENMKYDTQKPEGLLKRIIRGHSREGDIVADFFCGSGTTGVVAEQLGRRWIMADCANPAFRISRRRLLSVPEMRPWKAYRTTAAEEASTVELEVQVLETCGGKVLQITLQGYQLTEAQLQGAKKQRSALLALQQQDWLQLIEYWDVDIHYTGNGVFHSQQHSSRRYEGKSLGMRSVDWRMIFPWVSPLPCQIAVRMTDILGKETFLVRQVR